MNQLTEQIINEAVQHFAFDGDFVGARSFGMGHINDTYAAYFQMHDGKTKRYILQRINTNIFKSPEKLMENIANVTSYLRDVIIKAGGDPLRETLNLIPAIDGKNYYIDKEGGFWRSYIFIENATTFQKVENPQDFYNSARTFGRFQQLLADFPASTLHETIPNFHNTPDRMNKFKEAVEKDICGRVKNVKKEIAFVLAHEADTHVLVDLLNTGKLPLRVTHNDTKLNNVMIDDATGMGICVVDLDTVMPGLSLYDYGDSIRFGAATGAEDEIDLSHFRFDLNLFEVFTKGFLEVAGRILTPCEIENLPMGAKIMTLECGIRFLTDYLSGDVYFKIHRENHNLDRCRTQFKLVADMEACWDQMTEIVKKYAKPII